MKLIKIRKTKSFFLTSSIIASLCFFQGCSDPVSKNEEVQEQLIKAPIAEKVPFKMEQHGHTRIDNYYWMRDDERKDEKVLSYLKAENEYTDKVLAHTQPMQDKLFEEINNRIEKDQKSVPYKYKGYHYFYEYVGEQEYPIHKRTKIEDNSTEVIIDSNELAKKHEYFSLGSYEISPNSELMAYSSDTLSRRIYTIEVKNLTTGEMLSDKIENTSGQIAWANDNQTLFYVKKDPQTLLGYQVYRHKLGQPQSEDVLVYEEKDTSFYTSIGKTKDDSILLIYHGSTTRSGVSLLDANNPTGDFELFHELLPDLEYSVEKLGSEFYINTNYNAKNFQIMKVAEGKQNDINKWQPVIAHNAKVFIEDFEIIDAKLAIIEKSNGQSALKLMDLETNAIQNVTFEDPIFVVRFTGNSEIDASHVRVSYSSLTTPVSTYDIDINSLDKTLQQQQVVLGDFHPNNYKSERIFITARDNTQVPVSIVYRKDKFKHDGTNPLYVYGYGSYGGTVEPYFSSSRLSLIDRGFVYALAHVRGGQMMGREWYEQGKMFNKKNSFNDFIDVTKALVEQKYGASNNVFAAGGSAGGLLMGAVINQAPSLYKGVAAHVPFVDVVTTMLDESIPLTTNEFDEWGNPKNKDSYEYMLSYSPYDQVKKQDYPNLLVVTGLHDSQVQYFEPAKWVAKLRDMKTDSNKLVFKTDLDAGHGGASGRFKANKDRALEYAFFLDLAGIKE